MHIVQRNTFEYELNDAGYGYRYVPIFINEVWDNGKVVFQSFDAQKAFDYIENQEKIKNIIKTQIQKDLQFWIDSSNTNNEGEGLYNILVEQNKIDGIQTN